MNKNPPENKNKAEVLLFPSCQTEFLSSKFSKIHQME